MTAAKTTLSQAFNVRHILDDAVPEPQQQRRDLLTRVIVAAAKADRELDAQRDAFDQLRDLVINAPTRPDALTQQMVDLTARIAPSEQTLIGAAQQFSETALSSVADNAEAAKHRLTFADQNITNGAGPGGPAGGPIRSGSSTRSAPPNPRWARPGPCWTRCDSAATDINRAIATLPSAITDTQAGVDRRPRTCSWRRPASPPSSPPPSMRRPGRSPRPTATAPPIRWAPSPG